MDKDLRADSHHSAGCVLTHGVLSHEGQTWWAEPGAGNRLHQQSQTGGVMTQVQDPAKVSTWEQKETGLETGLETRLQCGSEVHAGGRVRGWHSYALLVQGLMALD